MSWCTAIPVCGQLTSHTRTGFGFKRYLRADRSTLGILAESDILQLPREAPNLANEMHELIAANVSYSCNGY